MALSPRRSRPMAAAALSTVLLIFNLLLICAPSSASAFASDTSCVRTNGLRTWQTVHQQQALAATSASETSATKETETPTSSSSKHSTKAEAKPSNLASLLDDAIKYDAKNSSSTLVNDLMTLRRSDDPMAAEKYLDDMLAIIDFNIIKRSIIPRPSTRLSRRARLKSMGRVLDLSTPSAEEGEDADDQVAVGRRRRRALAVLLRTLAKGSENDSNKGGMKTTIIRRIERAAIKDAKQNALYDDMSSRLPPGLETPKYEVVVRHPPNKGGYEIREYNPFTVCTVAMKSNIKANDEKRSKTDAQVSMPQLSGASSFGALAGYLFGKNSHETAMKMTMPVLTTNAGMDGTPDADTEDTAGTPLTSQKEMSFVLPSTYWSEDGTERAPQPLDGSGVRLQRDAGGTRATLMFGGFASKKEVEEKKAQLLSSLEDDEDYVMEEGATATLAQYNDPFTPPWKRLNEVSVPVRSRAR